MEPRIWWDTAWPWVQARVGPEACGALHAAVHGFVGQAVGVFVLVAQSVADLEAFEFGDAVSRFLPEGSEVGGVDLVLALDLLDHQLGVADDAEAGVVVVEGVLEAGEEAGVLGVVVGADAEELAELGEDVAVGVLNEGSEAGGAGVAAGSSVAVGADPVFGIFGGIFDLGSGGCGGFGEEAGRGRTVGHWVSLSEDEGMAEKRG